MDLLGSILGNMEKPPSSSDEQRKKERAEKAKLEKLHDEERKLKAKFRKEVEDQLSKFLNNIEQKRHKFSPMNKVQRTIVHDVAEIAGVIAHAFGKEEEGRYIIVFKKENPPTEEELSSYRRGEKWDPEVAGKVKETKQEHTSTNHQNVAKDNESKPSSNYKEKYRHLIGTSSAKDAARKTEANKAFGMVPSQNKRDVRSIEETMNEIRKKKRMKTENDEDEKR